MTTLGILGAGRVGTALARVALNAGFRVLLTNSRGPESLGLHVSILTPGAVASDLDTIRSEADLVYLALPLGRYASLPRTGWRGKVVIDGMNYWPAGEGTRDEFDSDPGSSSLVVQRHLTDARVVKTLNHIGYHDLEEDGLPEGTPDRRALGIAGDDADARAEVASFLSALGYDSLDFGGLKQGRRFGTCSAIFEGRFTRSEMALDEKNFLGGGV